MVLAFGSHLRTQRVALEPWPSINVVFLSISPFRPREGVRGTDIHLLLRG